MDWSKLLSSVFPSAAKMRDDKMNGDPVDAGKLFSHISTCLKEDSQSEEQEKVLQEAAKNTCAFATAVESFVKLTSEGKTFLDVICNRCRDMTEEDVTPENISSLRRSFSEDKISCHMVYHVEQNPSSVFWFLNAGHNMNRCYEYDVFGVVTEKDFTFLGFAVASDNISIVWKLLQHGLDVNLTGKSGSPLFKCVSKEMYDFLMAAGADDKIVDEYGRNAYFYIPDMRCLESIDVNVLDQDLCSILYRRAISHSLSLEMAQYLVERGSWLHLHTKTGEDILTIISAEVVPQEDAYLKQVVGDEEWEKVKSYLTKCYYLTAFPGQDV
jgi:hypothetical protein